MRKVNRILMATVAILLSLVLISTSIVSGIFARFVITKQASFSMQIEQFGVTLNLTPNTSAGNLVASQENTDYGVVAKLSFTSDLVMEQTIYDALKVELTGTANVKLKFRFDCKVDFNYESGNFTVDNNAAYGSAKGKTYMPLGFTVGFTKDANGDISDWAYVSRPYHIPANDNHIDEMITRNVANRVCGIKYNKDTEPITPYDSSTDTYYFEKEFSGAISGNINCFYLGFDWLSTGISGSTKYPTSNTDTNNLVATHLAEKMAGSPITITYTFHLEQID